MTGEVKFFRKRFFGGFNRDDVVKYVSKLAQERNECRTAKDKAETDARAMADEVEPLRLELELAKQEAQVDRDAKAEAERDVDRLNEVVESLRKDLKEAESTIFESRQAVVEEKQKSRKLNSELDSLKKELEVAQREAEEGRLHKAEALEARATIDAHKTAKRHFSEMAPALEGLRAVFEAGNKE